jgi:hypothetical protein
MQQHSNLGDQPVCPDGIMCKVVQQATTIVAFPVFLALSLLARPAQWLWDLGVSPEERKRYGKA